MSSTTKVIKTRMAYNKKNYYKRIIKVQTLVLEKQNESKRLFLKEIYWDYVYPEFNICYRTFHTWLGIPAKRELNKIQEQEELKRHTQLELW